MTTAEIEVSLGYNMNIAAHREGVNQNFVGVFLQVGRNAQMFGRWWDSLPHSPVRKILQMIHQIFA